LFVSLLQGPKLSLSDIQKFDATDKAPQMGQNTGTPARS